MKEQQPAAESCEHKNIRFVKYADGGKEGYCVDCKEDLKPEPASENPFLKPQIKVDPNMKEGEWRVELSSDSWKKLPSEKIRNIGSRYIEDEIIEVINILDEQHKEIENLKFEIERLKNGKQ